VVVHLLVDSRQFGASAGSWQPRSIDRRIPGADILHDSFHGSSEADCSAALYFDINILAGLAFLRALLDPDVRHAFGMPVLMILERTARS
jgi:hypothetical protein